MNKLVLLGLLGVLFFSCTNSSKQKAEQESADQAVVYSVDDLYTNATELEGKEVVVKGTVMHVCKHGGARCFLMGSNEDVNIRVEAGEKIGTFSQEQMGSDLEIVGVLKEVRTEADAHNPGQSHGEEGENAEDAETDQAHQVIANAQEASEVVYFIEGLKIKKEEI